MVALWVDDFIQCGDNRFYAKVVQELKRVFVLGKAERRDFTYVGWQVQQDGQRRVTVHQNSYLRNIEEVEKADIKGTKMEELSDVNQTRYRAGVGAMNKYQT